MLVFQKVVMGARNGGPVDEEELAHVELRGAGGRGATGCSGRGPEPDDGEAPYRPGRIQREDRSADDLGGLDAPEVGPVRQTADGGLCAGRTAVGGRIREPRRDDEGEGRSGRHLPRIAPDRPIRIHDGAPCERDRLHQGRPGTRLEQDRRRRCRLSIRRECERGERNANRGEDGSGLLHLLHLLNAFVLSNWADLWRAFVTVSLGLACPSRFVRGTSHPAAPGSLSTGITPLMGIPLASYQVPAAPWQIPDRVHAPVSRDHARTGCCLRVANGSRGSPGSRTERTCFVRIPSSRIRMTVWIVDAMNVIGSRPTGWWRN